MSAPIQTIVESITTGKFAQIGKNTVLENQTKKTQPTTTTTKIKIKNTTTQKNKNHPNKQKNP